VHEFGDIQPMAAQDTHAGRTTMRPLSRLFPYILRYKKLAGGAIISLLLAATTTLILPTAVRRLIDHGFTQSDSGFINTYFGMLMVLATVLAAASALRYYFVITLGERIVADLRRDVFDHITRLSPAFFDVNQSGEIVSRLTADTVQIKSAVGASASLALRNTILCLGAIAMMIYTSPKLSGLVLVAIPLIVFPLVGFGRSVRKRSREAQDRLAGASAYASEAIGAIRTVQAFNNARVSGRRRKMLSRPRGFPPASVLSSPALPSPWCSAASWRCCGSAPRGCWPGPSPAARSASSCSIR